MKFSWSNLMPWPYLPEDLRPQHRSLWIDIPNALYDSCQGHFVHHEYMDQLEDGVGVSEHRQNGYGLMPSI
jgi:hypothetical protein